MGWTRRAAGSTLFFLSREQSRHVRSRSTIRLTCTGQPRAGESPLQHNACRFAYVLRLGDSMSRLLTIVLLVLSPGIALAQSTLNECQVTIHVRVDDRDFSGRVQIEIFSTAGTPVDTVATNADGTATATMMSGASYRVRITGEGIEP